LLFISLLFRFGGYNGQAWLNDLWVYDIETFRWTCIQESSDPVPALEEAPAVAAPAGEPPSGVRGMAPSRRFGYVSVVHEGTNTIVYVTRALFFTWELT
jgi:hypothetical protein